MAEISNFQLSISDYVEMQMPIIPLCSHDHSKMSAKHKKTCKCSGKTPLIKGWQSRQTTTQEEISQWLLKYGEKMNFGLPLGDTSGYVGIDIDGDMGEIYLEDLSSGNLPATWEYTTGAGRRLIYQIPMGMKTKKFKQANKGGGHQECALLCEGQQTVIPPSIHHTGSKYEWIKDHSPIECDCAMAPDWLIDLIQIKPAEGMVINLADVSPAEEANHINVDSIDSLAKEFDTNTDFDNSVPDPTYESKKKGKGKSGHEVIITDEILNAPIAEGQRDNTMTAIVGHFCAKYRALGKDNIIALALKHNQDHCIPPLEDDAIIAKVNHFWELEKFKSAQFGGIGDKKFNADSLASSILEVIDKKWNNLLMYDGKMDAFYLTSKTKGPWRKLDIEQYGLLEARIKKLMVDPKIGDPNWGTIRHKKEVMEAIKDNLRNNGKGNANATFDLGEKSSEMEKYIVVNNGMINWKTKEIVPWDPEFKTIIGFNIDYDPDLDCPHWRGYMEDWIPDETTRNLLQEFAGYCLIPSIKIHKALFLVGGGSNGKSMFLETIEQFFEEFAAAVSPQRLAERFGSAAIYHKVVNICKEIDEEYIKHTNMLKALISGDTTEFERKGKDVVRFRNVARFIFSANKLPQAKDKSLGWYRRLMIVEFKNTFKDDWRISEEMNRNIAKEKTAIFNWMLEGLSRLMERGVFLEEGDIAQNLTEYKRNNDPIEDFLKSCTRGLPMIEVREARGAGTLRAGISTKTLYELFTMWSHYARGTEIRLMDRRRFVIQVRSKGILKDKGYCVVTGSENIQCFLGITADLNDIDLWEHIKDVTAFSGKSEIDAILADYLHEKASCL